MDEYTVYKHTNKINGKVYIGITKRPVLERWRVGKGYKSQYFSRAIAKYGWDNFDHEIIDTGLSKRDACQREKALIKAHKSHLTAYGYNMTWGGDGGGMLNHCHTDSAKEKIRIARKRIGFSEKHKQHISIAKTGLNHHFAKKVYQYDKSGNFIKEWPYMSLAANQLNISKGNIGEVCNGNRKTAGGFIWKYERV